MGKKKAKGKKKGNIKEKKATKKEILLSYQIHLKTLDRDEALGEIKILQEGNEKHRERISRLKTLKQQREDETVEKVKAAVCGQMDSGDVTGDDDVIRTLHGKNQEELDQKLILKDIQDKIQLEEVNVADVERELQFWREFRDRGCHELQGMISSLERQLKDQESLFCEMKDFRQRSHKEQLDTMATSSLELLVRKSDEASQKALNDLTALDLREVADNQWLQKEVAKYLLEAERLEESCDLLEAQNLKLMTSRVEELSLGRYVPVETRYERTVNSPDYVTYLPAIPLKSTLKLEGRQIDLAKDTRPSLTEKKDDWPVTLPMLKNKLLTTV